MQLSLTVNGRTIDAEVEPRVLLVEFLRDAQGLTGTKVGCETGQCGACTVLLDNRSVKSCSMLAVQADGGELTTIEGITGENGQAGLDELQQALWEQHGTQCGFCAPGVVLSLHDLLNRKGTLGEPEVRSWLSGNLCRCTGYRSIVRAALSVAGGAEGKTDE
jgi:carbon-monoxide dehydrogenase small subunit